ncbi:hypothetical protein [Kutzneria sp. CA-103260]|uniref:hypothetical protein n=1 Tax=Kutzneria sp. CA-103260 TaxID=2802641 RepID=UPI001BAC884E|nr:hypothetical protein [Kutzneria sp. CA-103260]
MSRENDAPGAVRAAGVMVAVQGLAALAVAVVALVHGIGGVPANLAYGEAGIFVVIAIACGLPGVLLWQGRRGARNAAVFLQLLVVGGIWWGFNPVDSLPVDILFTAYCAAVLVLLLFLEPSRLWAMGIAKDGSQVP